MCPECISTAAMLTAGVSSAGGVGALIVSKLRGKKHADLNLRRKDSNTGEPVSASFEEWIAAVEVSENNSQH